MKLIDFSDRSVALANAALTLGFDVVEKSNYSVQISGKIHIKVITRLKSVSQSYDLSSNDFPELNPTGTDAADPNFSSSTALTYIVHHKEINTSSVNIEKYEKQDMENVYRPMNDKDQNGNILIFDAKTLIDEHKARFITNFSRNIVDKIYLAILKTRESQPYIGKNIFIYKESFSEDGENAGKFGVYTELYSLWYKCTDCIGCNIDDDLHDFWMMVWEAQGVRY